MLIVVWRASHVAEKRQRLVREEFKTHPVLHHPLDLDRYPRLTGEKWGAKSMQRLADWIKKSPALRTRVEEMAKNADSKKIRDAARHLLFANSEEEEKN